MNRRTFFRRTFAASLAAALHPALSSGGRMRPRPFERSGGPKIKLSLNAYSFNAALRQSEMTLDDLLPFCAQEGFDAVDPTGYYFPGYPKAPPDEYLYEFKRKAHLLGLDISGTGVRNDFASPDASQRRRDIALIKDWIQVAARLGAPLVRVFAGKRVPDGFSWQQTADWMASALRECAEFGARYGVFIALQNHAGFLKTADDVLTLLRLVDSKWLGVHLDIGSFPTADPYQEIRRVAPYAINWQIKEKIKTDRGPLETDLKKVFTIVREANYRGYVCIETLGPGDAKAKVRRFLEKVHLALDQTKR